MTNTQAVNGYQLFHAKRVFDVLLGVQTPRNDYDNGISADGNFLNRDSREKVATVISSLFELGLICKDEHDQMLAINNACDYKASAKDRTVKLHQIALPPGCLTCVCPEHEGQHDRFKGIYISHWSACRFPKPVQNESEKRREWARDLQEVRGQLERRANYNTLKPNRFHKLTLEKLKRIQNEIYNLNEEQGE